MDGDARGGAALSIRAVTGAPVKFVGTGEKPDALEPFHPERMASRILGMGDMLTLDRTGAGARPTTRRRRWSSSGSCGRNEFTHGRITEGNVEGALNEVRLALLEADVNFKVVKDFVAAVKEKALGADVLATLTPDQQFIKIVHEEMTRMMGAQAQELNLARRPPVPVMLVGLQGSGKTTTCGKLALYLRKRKRTPFLVPADVYRPAAIEQLKVLGRQLEIPVFDSRPTPTRWRSAGRR